MCFSTATSTSTSTDDTFLLVVLLILTFDALINILVLCNISLNNQETKAVAPKMLTLGSMLASKGKTGKQKPVNDIRWLCTSFLFIPWFCPGSAIRPTIENMLG